MKRQSILKTRRAARYALATSVATIGVLIGAGVCTNFADAAIQNPATATFNVTITILKQCTVTAPSTISLGSIGATDLITTTTNGTQTFTVTCSKTTPYTVGFASTNDLAAGSTTHQMKGTAANTDVVKYNLFDVTSGASNTAALSASSSVISDTGTGAVQTKSLKAQVVSYTAPVTPDVYTDTVTMSVTY
jgi:spore coat protein U-like protein